MALSGCPGSFGEAHWEHWTQSMSPAPELFGTLFGHVRIVRSLWSSRKVLKQAAGGMQTMPPFGYLEPHRYGYIPERRCMAVSLNWGTFKGSGGLI